MFYLDIPRPAPEALSNSGIVLAAAFEVAAGADDRAMLRRMFGACGFAADDARVATVEVGGEPKACGPALGAGGVAHLLAFGLAPARVGLQLEAKPYAWLPLGRGRVCFAESLAVIGANQQRKRRLWDCLKEVKAALEQAADLPGGG